MRAATKKRAWMLGRWSAAVKRIAPGRDSCPGVPSELKAELVTAQVGTLTDPSRLEGMGEGRDPRRERVREGRPLGGESGEGPRS